MRCAIHLIGLHLNRFIKKYKRISERERAIMRKSEREGEIERNKRQTKLILNNIERSDRLFIDTNHHYNVSP